MFDKIDHIGVAVEDIERALGLWRDRLELDVGHREISEEQGVEAVLLDLGTDHIELMAPLGPKTPVGKFLAKRGPGLHHVAYTVSDIEATLTALGQAGVRLIDKSPRAGLRDSRVAFVHPKAVGGVLIEVVEPPPGKEH
jgi:methylmalonyl-CoA/ethylmalonyl-CoA epimerase